MTMVHGENDRDRPTTRLAAEGKRVAVAIACVLLPDPPRGRLARDWQVDPARWSLAWGAVEAGLGALLYMERGIAFMRGAASGIGVRLLEAWTPELSTTDFQGAGALGWLAWLLFPGSWPYAYLVLVGAGRIVAWAASRETFGEPPLVAIFAIARRLAARSERRRRRRRLGPDRPDRWIAQGQGWIVLSARPKPDWTTGVTVERGERFYRLDAVEEVADGAVRAVGYRLVPLPEGALVRRLIRHDPDAPATPPAGGSAR